MKKKRVLPNGWHEVVIGKEFKTGSGGTPLSTRKEYYEGGTIPWINSGELNENYIDRTDNYISELGLNNSSAKLYPKGTVLVAMYGATAGKSSILNIEACTNQAICAILENSNYSSLFVKYSIENLYDYLVNKSTGSARDNLSQEGIAELSLFFPDGKDRQERLIKILKDIDQKISINVRMNAELEAMAKQLYDYWFVQFDFPNENGKPYKSSGGKMVYNEKLKREIPEGWEIQNLFFIANYKNGLACQNYRPKEDEESLPVIKINEMHNGFTSETERASANIPSEVIIENGDVLFAWSASLEVMLWGLGRGALNQHIFKVTSNNGFPKSFFYYQLLEYVDYFRRIAEAKKTTMGHITKDHLEQSQIVVPPTTDLPNQLEEILSPIMDKMVSLSSERIYLTHLRDSLLPMLMNGQVTVE